MENTVNDYFVNILDMGNESVEASMIYLSVPNLPSKYLIYLIIYISDLFVRVLLQEETSDLILFHICISDLHVRVLSREETENRFREIGRDDHLGYYRRLMRRCCRRRRRVRRRLINTSNQTP